MNEPRKVIMKHVSWNYSVQFLIGMYEKAGKNHFLWKYSTKAESGNGNSHQRCSVKKGILQKFAKFTGKHLCQSLLYNKVAGLRPATLLRKRLWHRCFPVNFAKFLTTPLDDCLYRNAKRVNILSVLWQASIFRVK